MLVILVVQNQIAQVDQVLEEGPHIGPVEAQTRQVLLGAQLGHLQPLAQALQIFLSVVFFFW